MLPNTPLARRKLEYLILGNDELVELLNRSERRRNLAMISPDPAYLLDSCISDEDAMIEPMSGQVLRILSIFWHWLMDTARNCLVNMQLTYLRSNIL